MHLSSISSGSCRRSIRNSVVLGLWLSSAACERNLPDALSCTSIRGMLLGTPMRQVEDLWGPPASRARRPGCGSAPMVSSGECWWYASDGIGGKEVQLVFSDAVLAEIRVTHSALLSSATLLFKRDADGVTETPEFRAQFACR